MLQAFIFFDKEERADVNPLHQYIIGMLQQEGITGATVFRELFGFGRHHRLKELSQYHIIDEPAMMITFIDEDSKVHHALTELRKVFRGGMIVTHPVEIW